jgi:hypothetical protein
MSVVVVVVAVVIGEYGGGSEGTLKNKTGASVMNSCDGFTNFYDLAIK